MLDNEPAARGRHAPPPEIRLPLQRERLLQAAAEEFASLGYGGASAESISRCAGMSKATFYEHFANKEDCIVALLQRAAEVVGESMAAAARDAGPGAGERLQAATRAFLGALAAHPEFAQTLVVEIVGAGPEAMRRRDEIVAGFAALMDAERFVSPHDPFAVVGAINELVSRQVRLGEPADILELTSVIDRLIAGLLAP
jgi:AcrR family transcriptional regulator